MATLDDFSIDQLMLFIVGVMGATGALCLSIQRSKCKKLKLCCGLVDCDRDVDAVIADSVGERRPSLKPNEHRLSLELREPEPEPEPESIKS